MGRLTGTRTARAAGWLRALGIGVLLAAPSEAVAGGPLFGEAPRSPRGVESRTAVRRLDLEHRIDDVARDLRRRREERQLHRSGSPRDVAAYLRAEQRRDETRELSERLDRVHGPLPGATLSQQLERVRDQIDLERRARELARRAAARAELGRTEPEQTARGGSAP